MENKSTRTKKHETAPMDVTGSDFSTDYMDHATDYSTDYSFSSDSDSESLPIAPLIASDNINDEKVTEKRLKKVDVIIKDGVGRCATFEQVITKVTKFFAGLDRREKAYVEHLYVDLCLSEFLSQVQDILETDIAVIYNDLGSFAKYIENVNQISQLAKYFATLNHCSLLVQCDNLGLVNKQDLQKFLWDLKCICSHAVVRKVRAVNSETEFINELKFYLKQCFLLGTKAFEGQIKLKGNTRSVTSHLLSYLKTDITDFDDEHITDLRRVAWVLSNADTLSENFYETLFHVLKSYTDRVVIEITDKNNQRIVKCEGGYIRLSELSTTIDLQYGANYDEIRIYAPEILHANQSVGWPGKNVAIVTPLLFVEDDIEIDVSGRDGQIRFDGAKADDGNNNDRNGKPGCHGDCGESGGNVLLLCDGIVNQKQLYILSNGGDGTGGQSGGDGKPGKDGLDGRELTKEEFDENYPAVAYFSGRTSGSNRARIRDNIREKTEYSDGQNRFWKGTTREGFKITFSYYFNAYAPLALGIVPGRQAYLLIKGEEGEKGEPGGDGGKAGKGGEGGYSGVINIKPLSVSSKENFSVHTGGKKGKDGKDGTDGRGAKAGKDGKRGRDRARVEPRIFTSTRDFYGVCQLRYHDSDGANFAWCWYNKKYAEITTDSIPSAKVTAREGVKGKNNNGQDERQQVLRKMPVFEEEIRSQCNDVIKHNTGLYSTAKYSSRLHVSLPTSQLSALQVSRLQPNARSDATVRINRHVLHHIPSKVKSKVNEVFFTQEIFPTENVFLKELQLKCEYAMNDTDLIGIYASLYSAIKSKQIDKEKDKEALWQLFDMTADIIKIWFVISKEKVLKLLFYLDFISLQRADGEPHSLKQLLFEKYKVALLNDTYIKVDPYRHLQKIDSTDVRSVLEGEVQQQVDEMMMKLIVAVKDEHYSEDFAKHIETKISQLCQEAEKIHRAFMLIRSKSSNENIESSDGAISLLGMPCSNTDENNATMVDNRHHCEETGPEVVKYNSTLQESGSQQTDVENKSLSRDSDDKSLEALVKSLPNNLRILIYKFQYLQAHHGDEVGSIIAKRIQLEGLQISYEIIKWLITQVLCEIDTYGPAEYVILFGTKPQVTWLSEYTLLQLKSKIQMTFHEKLELQSKLREYRSADILLFLSQQISHRSTEELTQSAICDILDTSNRIAIDEQIMIHLQNIKLTGWPLRLKWFKSMLDISDIKTGTEWDRADIEKAAYFVSELTNRYGDGEIDRLVKVLQQQNYIEKETVMSLLHNFYRNKWTLDSSSWRILRKQKNSNWLDSLASIFHAHDSRSLDILVQLMKQDNNNSKKIREGIQIAENDVNEVYKIKQEKYGTFLHSSKQIVEYKEMDIKNWLKAFHKECNDCEQSKEEFVDQNFAEILAVIDQAICLKRGFYLRQTQMLSLVLFILNKEKALLEQISTGEGKSLIIVSLAIIKALQGYNVDVLTSSQVLARRDAENNGDIFNVFEIAVGHNCSEEIFERQKIYSKMSVVYGEIGAFQRDSLLDDFYDKDVGIGSRKRGYVIVDEVDSMLLDKGQNVLYLSHNIPGMDALEPVYVYIWQFVNAKGMLGSEEDRASVEECIRGAMYPTIQTHTLADCLQKCKISEFRESFISQLWAEFIELGLIDSKGRILCTDAILSNTNVFKDLSQLQLEIQQKLLGHFKDAVRQETPVQIPSCLVGFVERHLRQWVENAFKAKHMVVNDNYIIDFDRSDSSPSRDPNVIIMDKDTGVEQYNSQWSHGLHQFLQLKHSCRLSFESLKAVYMSNVSFFRQYGKRLNGLSGTLGSVKERDFLKSMYKTEYATIPTDRLSQFEEHLSKICASEEAWIQEIESSVTSLTSRPALVICQNVHDVEKLENHFKHVGKHLPLKVYKHSYEQFFDEKAELEQPCVIIATNLAGRGTDIRLSNGLSKRGGLHVCLTYLPPNVRVEEQAFGRAARKGQEGSGQLIAFAPYDDDEDFEDSSLRVTQMKVKRNMEEEEHIDTLKTHFEQVIEPEENLFRVFKLAYQCLERYLKDNPEYQEPQREIILNSCLDEWAFRLDEATSGPTEQLEVAEKIITCLVKEIETSIEMEDCLRLVCRPAQRLKLAKHNCDKKQYTDASYQLKCVISEDAYFSDVAHYYMCAVEIRRTNATSDRDKNNLYWHLCAAHKGLANKSELQAYYAHVVSLIAEQFKPKRLGFLVSDDYKKQKQDIIEIYNVFLQSLAEITGSELTLSMILNCSNMNVKLGTECYRSLKGKKNIETAIIIAYEKIESLRSKYELYFSEIKNSLSVRANKAITAKHLQGIFPSREEFWSVLKKANMVKNERHYVVVDIRELDKHFKEDETVSNFKDMLETKQTCEEFTGFVRTYRERFQLDKSESPSPDVPKRCEIPICLFHEHLKDVQINLLKPSVSEQKSTTSDDHPRYVVLKRELFEKTYGSVKDWKALRQRQILTLNTTAILRYDEKKRLEKYDGLTKAALLSIEGITDEMAEDLYDDLTTNGIVSKESPYLQLLGKKHEDFKLHCHRHFETEVLNTLDKYFKYRIALMELLKDGMVSLESKPHKDLFDCLIAEHIIKPQMVHPEEKEDSIKGIVQEIIAESSGDSGDSEEERLQLIENLKDILFNSKTGLTKFEVVDSSFKDLAEYFDGDEKYKKLYELKVFQSNGFGDVIVLTEKRWSRKVIFRIVAIFLIGLTQFLVGLALEVFTAGLGSFIAQGLVGEGIGDMIFALECAFSGYCTWKSYKQHKIISVTITVLSCGIGAWFSRGAKFSRYGTKIGGEHLKHMCGMQLLKEVGWSRLRKEIAIRAGKKLLEASALTLANYAVDAAVVKLINSTFRGISESVIKNTDFSKLRDAVSKLANKAGLERATRLIQEATQKVFGQSSHIRRMVEQLTTVLSHACSVTCNALNKASKRVENASYAVIVNVISEVLKYAKFAKALADIQITVDEFVSRLQGEIEKVTASAKCDKTIRTSKRDVTRFTDSVISNWKQSVSTVVSSKIGNELARPVLQSLANSAVSYVGKKVKDAYANYTTSCQYDRLFALRQEYDQVLVEQTEQCQSEYSLQDAITQAYHEQLTSLLQKTRDPHLFAEIIREGVPVSIHSCQAVCEILGRPVVIMHNEDSCPFPTEFKPSVPCDQTPIVIGYSPGSNSTVGHFTAFGVEDQRHSEPIGKVNNNCLLDAVSSVTGQTISREQIACTIEKNDKIGQLVRDGIHEHFLGKGALGGIQRTPIQEMKMDEKIQKVRTGEINVEKMKPSKRYVFRDAANLSEGSIKKSGNHELLQVSNIKVWKEKAVKDHESRQTSAGYDHLDVFEHCRTDTRYVLFEAEAGISGHSGAVYSSENEGKLTGGLTAGSQEYHAKMYNGVKDLNTAQDTAVRAAVNHLNLTIDPEKLQYLELDKDVYTTTGHNLRIPEERAEFCIGYKRERYKMSLLANKLNGNKPVGWDRPIIRPENDPYCKQIEKELKNINSQDIKSIGRYMMSPAPCPRETVKIKQKIKR